MGKSTGVDDDSVGLCRGNERDQLRLVVSLVVGDLEVESLAEPDQIGDQVVEGSFAVDLRLPGAQRAQVGAVEDQDPPPGVTVLHGIEDKLNAVTPKQRVVTYAAVVVLGGLVLGACSSPLLSLGNRSSRWINEPEVSTTTIPEVDAPVEVPSTNLQWHNDEIVSGPFESSQQVVDAVFARREGDRFIQASRAEIAAAVPAIVFPAMVPFGAEWVSSQLVIENNGSLSAEPTAAFGIWSSEPYTRSRSVAQMVVLRVAHDPDTAGEVDSPDSAFSCARFAEEATEECALTELAGRDTWRLTSSSGVTLIWFDGEYRYELFGRNFVPIEVLEDMATESVPLAELAVG